MKKQRFAIVLSAVAVILAFGFYVQTEDSVFFKINKSLQIFGEVFRQISGNYVDEIEPEAFIKSGIEGMLAYLDPYTTYYEEKDSDELDILTNGVYGGLGITVGTIDSTLTIVGVAEGFASEKAGLRVGDKIYKIDSTVVQSLGSGELGRYTRGKPGAKVVMFIIRGDRKDTMRFELIRQEITLKNILYSGVMANDIGYIRLERFSRSAPAEIRAAIEKMKSTRKLNGLILDLRDNPGGLLESAVAISEMFVPTGSLIVSTKGRTPASERKYVSRNAPLEPTLPLAVLTNDHSASASEIVAGAIQDLDRGILVGERSFGKGLVQTISSLPFNANLKMTTAKYYTPSGRCIQKIDYSSKHRTGIFKISGDTSKIFHTTNGRSLLESNGITPDTTVSLKEMSEFISEVVGRGMLFNFATIFTGRKDSLPKNFAVTKDVISTFTEFLQAKKFTFNGSAYKKIHDLAEILKKEKYPSNFTKKVEQLEKDLSDDLAIQIEQQRPELSRLLEDEIFLRFYPRSKVIEMSLSHDIQVQTAANLLQNQAEYTAMLGAKTKNEH